MSTHPSLLNRLADERGAWRTLSAVPPPSAGRTRRRTRLWLPLSGRTVVRAAVVAGIVWAVTTGGQAAGEWWQAYLTGGAG